MTGTRTPARVVFAVLAALAGAMFVVTLSGRSLWAPDEGRYAEIAREMLQSGDWLTPRLNGVRYFEKPPLVYWMTAASFAVFGTSEAAARLPVALCGLGLLAVTAWLGAMVAGRRAGLLAGVLLATCPGWYTMSQYLVLDMPLALFVSAGLAAFWRGWTDALRPDRDLRPRWRAWLIGASALFGLGTLVKGPIAVVLAGMVCAPVVLARPRQAVRVPWGRMLAVFLLVTAPWFIAIGIRHPEFIRFFFVHEHFERYLETGHARPGPVWYFLPVLIAGLFPWSCLAPAGWWRPPRLRFGAGVLVGAWIALPVAFFSLSQSKLPPYVLPVFPALAVWLAAALEPLMSGERPPGRTLAAGAGLVVVAASLVVAQAMKLHPSDQRALIAIRGMALVPIVGCGLGGLAAMELFRRRRVRAGFGVLLGIALVSLAGLGLVAPHYEPTKDCKVLSRELAARRPAGEPVMVYGTLESAASLPFYVGETVLVGGHYYGELAFARAAPKDGEEARFVPASRVEPMLAPTAPRVWVVTGLGVYRDWFQGRLGLKPKLVREYGGRVLFTNR